MDRVIHTWRHSADLLQLSEDWAKFYMWWAVCGCAWKDHPEGNEREIILYLRERENINPQERMMWKKAKGFKKKKKMNISERVQSEGKKNRQEVGRKQRRRRRRKWVKWKPIDEKRKKEAAFKKKSAAALDDKVMTLLDDRFMFCAL